jgi:hypothetical protein
VEIQYQRTFEDYREAAAAQRAKLTWRGKVIGVVIFVPLYILLVILLMSFGMRQGAAVLSIAVGLPLLASLVSYGYRSWLKRDFRRHSSIGLPEVARIDDIGLHIESDVGGGTAKWRGYTKFKETQNLFVLYLGPRMAHVLPKRAFSHKELGEFRRLVDANLQQVGRNRNERIEHTANS